MFSGLFASLMELFSGSIIELIMGLISSLLGGGLLGGLLGGGA